MKRLMVLVLVAIFALSAALSAAPGKAPVKAKPVKKPVVSDQLLIKKAVLAWDATRSKEKPHPLNRVKFDPIKIESGWATTTYNMLNSKGKAIMTTGNQEMQVQYLLKKKKGKWRVVMQYVESYIEPLACKKVGLSKETAKKLGITSDSFQ